MLEARDLAVGFGKKPILSGINLTVQPGDWLGLVGPNGCGKTTLLKTLCGILRPVSGSLSWEGRDLAGQKADALGRLFAYQPQVPNQEVAFTVSEMVALGRTPYHRFFSLTEEDLVEAVIDMVGLKELADRPVVKLSGGQFQRVILARTLAQTPQGLFLDEPNAHLDPGQGIDILLLVRDLLTGRRKIAGLAGRPRIVVAAFHDLNLAWQFSNKIVLFGQTGLLAAGRPDEVLSQENIEKAFGPNISRSRDESGQTVFIARF